MSIRDFFSRLFNESPDKKIKKLLDQLEKAMSDLQIRIADSIARSSGLKKALDETNNKLTAISSDNSIQQANIAERIDSIKSSLHIEQQAEIRLRQIFEDLKNRQQLQLSYQQSLSRLRNAEVSNLLASIHKDFGSDMKLNNYLEKLSEESFRIEFTADSRLKIEMLLDESKKL